MRTLLLSLTFALAGVVPLASAQAPQEPVVVFALDPPAATLAPGQPPREVTLRLAWSCSQRETMYPDQPISARFALSGLLPGLDVALPLDELAVDPVPAGACVDSSIRHWANVTATIGVDYFAPAFAQQNLSARAELVQPSGQGGGNYWGPFRSTWTYDTGYSLDVTSLLGLDRSAFLDGPDESGTLELGLAFLANGATRVDLSWVVEPPANVTISPVRPLVLNATHAGGLGELQRIPLEARLDPGYYVPESRFAVNLTVTVGSADARGTTTATEWVPVFIRTANLSFLDQLVSGESGGAFIGVFLLVAILGGVAFGIWRSTH